MEGRRGSTAMVVLVTVAVPSGIGLMGIGASVRGDNARAWFLAGGWTVGLTLLALFTWGVVWPAAKWFTGPLQERISRSSIRGLEILSASYHGINVTWHLNQRVLDDKLSIVVTPADIGVDDPAVGVVKTLDVKYRAGGKERQAAAIDGTPLTLP